MKRRGMSDDVYFFVLVVLLTMLGAAIVLNIRKIEHDMAACARLPGHATVAAGLGYSCRLVGYVK